MYLKEYKALIESIPLSRSPREIRRWRVRANHFFENERPGDQAMLDLIKEAVKHKHIEVFSALCSAPSPINIASAIMSEESDKKIDLLTGWHERFELTLEWLAVHEDQSWFKQWVSNQKWGKCDHSDRHYVMNYWLANSDHLTGAMRSLLDLGWPVDGYPKSNQMLSSPLRNAACSLAVNMVQLLLKSGANIHDLSSVNETILNDVCLLAKHTPSNPEKAKQCIMMLINAGASCTAGSRPVTYPFALAYEQKFKEQGALSTLANDVRHSSARSDQSKAISAPRFRRT